jgi:hypothetical protein
LKIGVEHAEELFEDSAQKHGKKKVAVGDHDLWIGAGNSLQLPAHDLRLQRVEL